MTYIRYFATNRDREHLGRDIARSTRIKMQRGGYNWIDTKRCMSYYLAETDPDRLPKEALIESSEQPIFKDFLAKRSIKRVIICVHGFNVPLHGALTSFTVLTDTLRDIEAFSSESDPLNLIVDPTRWDAKEKLDDETNALTAVVGFSWPSNGQLLSYASDRTEAAASAPVLANLISAIRDQNPDVAIFIIAHSLGNFLVCNMLNGLVTEKYPPLYNNEAQAKRLLRRDQYKADYKEDKKKFFIDGYFMLAPDVERRHVTKCFKGNFSENEADAYGEDNNEEVLYLGPFYEGLLHLVGGIYLFYSRHDKALQASKIEKEARERMDDIKELFLGRNMDNLWEDSLGLNPAPPLAPVNMRSYNSSTLSNMPIDHGNYFDIKGIAKKIACEIIQY